MSGLNESGIKQFLEIVKKADEDQLRFMKNNILEEIQQRDLAIARMLTEKSLINSLNKE